MESTKPGRRQKQTHKQPRCVLLHCGALTAIVVIVYNSLAYVLDCPHRHVIEDCIWHRRRSEHWMRCSMSSGADVHCGECPVAGVAGADVHCGECPVAVAGARTRSCRRESQLHTGILCAQHNTCTAYARAHAQHMHMCSTAHAYLASLRFSFDRHLRVKDQILLTLIVTP